MNKLKPFFILLLAIISASCSSSNSGYDFNSSWYFHKVDSTDNESHFSAANFDHSEWSKVSTPHTASIEPYIVNDAWQGVCWYRKTFDISNYSNEKNYFIEFEGAMNICKVWINGSEVKEEQGGYLPVVIDATPYLRSSQNVIAVRLDNNDNPTTGPKPLKMLDFVMYSGLYRPVHFIEKNSVYITNANLEDRVAGGGVFITYPKVDQKLSKVSVKTDIKNSSENSQAITVVQNILDGDKLVKSVQKNYSIASQSSIEDGVVIDIEHPKLWSPKTPNLYTLNTLILAGADTLDVENTQFGIREFTFKGSQLYINGEKWFLRGTNRHQEYPYVGYALSDRAQLRDAIDIKNGGFDFVRLSHYPHSTAFMNACDQLGIVVLDAVLGWQYYRENEDFKNQIYKTATQLVRRDRNHPCVLAWEVSLNETKMPVEFMQNLHDIVHSEYPAKNVYSCGWMDDVYDIYLQARQHRILHPTETNYNKPYSVSEYGDWEYYSNNGGLNQHKLDKSQRKEQSSRHYRSEGEKAMLQQAYNVQEAHNDNLSIPAFGDSYWVMYDYNSGVHNDQCNCGLMDINRLPKYGYYFYASQRDLVKSEDAMLFIASNWDENSGDEIKVYSNAEEVELFINNKLVAKQLPDTGVNCENLPHPPFTFKIDKFEEGELKAISYYEDKASRLVTVKTAKKPVALKCWVDNKGVEAKSGCNDLVFVRIAAVDENGTINPYYNEPLEVSLDKNLTLMNSEGVKAEAGIASALVQIGSKSGEFKISATSADGLSGEGVVSVL